MVSYWYCHPFRKHTFEPVKVLGRKRYQPIFWSSPTHGPVPGIIKICTAHAIATALNFNLSHVWTELFRVNTVFSVINSLVAYVFKRPSPRASPFQELDFRGLLFRGPFISARIRKIRKDCRVEGDISAENFDFVHPVHCTDTALNLTFLTTTYRKWSTFLHQMYSMPLSCPTNWDCM